jgi:hypothetical protein
MAAYVLIDAGPIIAYYNKIDKWHIQARKFIESSREQFITTVACITEALYFLKVDYRVQNELLLDLSIGLYACEQLTLEDFSKIAELNAKYNDLPADFADLSLVAISERLSIETIASLDDDFLIYRRYGKKKFKHVFS